MPAGRPVARTAVPAPQVPAPEIGNRFTTIMGPEEEKACLEANKRVEYMSYRTKNNGAWAGDRKPDEVFGKVRKEDQVIWFKPAAKKVGAMEPATKKPATKKAGGPLAPVASKVQKTSAKRVSGEKVEMAKRAEQSEAWKRVLRNDKKPQPQGSSGSSGLRFK